MLAINKNNNFVPNKAFNHKRFKLTQTLGHNLNIKRSVIQQSDKAHYERHQINVMKIREEGKETLVGLVKFKTYNLLLTLPYLMKYSLISAAKLQKECYFNYSGLWTKKKLKNIEEVERENLLTRGEHFGLNRVRTLGSGFSAIKYADNYGNYYLIFYKFEKGGIKFRAIVDISATDFEEIIIEGTPALDLLNQIELENIQRLHSDRIITKDSDDLADEAAVEKDPEWKARVSDPTVPALKATALVPVQGNWESNVQRVIFKGYKSAAKSKGLVNLLANLKTALPYTASNIHLTVSDLTDLVITKDELKKSTKTTIEFVTQTIRFSFDQTNFSIPLMDLPHFLIEGKSPVEESDFSYSKFDFSWNQPNSVGNTTKKDSHKEAEEGEGSAISKSASNKISNIVASHLPKNKEERLSVASKLGYSLRTSLSSGFYNRGYNSTLWYVSLEGGSWYFFMDEKAILNGHNETKPQVLEWVPLYPGMPRMKFSRKIEVGNPNIKFKIVKLNIDSTETLEEKTITLARWFNHSHTIVVTMDTELQHFDSLRDVYKQAERIIQRKNYSVESLKKKWELAKKQENSVEERESPCFSVSQPHIYGKAPNTYIELISPINSLEPLGGGVKDPILPYKITDNYTPAHGSAVKFEGEWVYPPRVNYQLTKPETIRPTVYNMQFIREQIKANNTKIIEAYIGMGWGNISRDEKIAEKWLQSYRSAFIPVLVDEWHLRQKKLAFEKNKKEMADWKKSNQKKLEKEEKKRNRKPTSFDWKKAYSLEEEKPVAPFPPMTEEEKQKWAKMPGELEKVYYVFKPEDKPEIKAEDNRAKDTEDKSSTKSNK